MHICMYIQHCSHAAVQYSSMISSILAGSHCSKGKTLEQWLPASLEFKAAPLTGSKWPKTHSQPPQAHLKLKP